MATKKKNSNNKKSSTTKKTSLKNNTNKSSTTLKTSSKKGNNSTMVKKGSVSSKKTSVNSNKPTTKKTTTAKKETKTSSVKITTPSKTTTKKQEPKKKITSTKKIMGKEVPNSKSKQKNNGVNKKSNTFQKNVKSSNNSLAKKINVVVLKFATLFKTFGKTIITKTKDTSKKITSRIRLLFKKDKEEKNENVKLKENRHQDVNDEIKRKKFNFVLKRKTRIKIILLSVLCLIIAVLLKIPFGSSIYLSGASNKTLDVPKFVRIKEECCAYNATFSTIRSVWSLEKDLEKIMNGYELLQCDNKTYYYNRNENYTVTDYGVKNGILFNEVYITYGVGNSCDIDTKFKKLELLAEDFSLQDARRDGNYVMDGDKVYNKEAYDNFMANVENKIPSVIRIVTTNSDGDVLITDLEYLSDGKYLVSYDGTRDRNAKNHNSIIAYKFNHLKVSQNKLYAYNGDKLVIKNAKKYETYYLLDVPNE